MGSVQGMKAPDATGEPPEEGDELQVIARSPPQSDPSIKSYGLDPAPPRPTGPGEATTRLLMRARRAKLSRIVVAAVAACGAILVAAGVAHMARANNPDTAPRTSSLAVTTPASAPAPSPIPAATAAVPSRSSTAPDTPTTGTLLLQRPAVPGRVWLDGNKLTNPTAVVTCGQHQVKVGARGKAHAIDVPCGGELHLTH
jgi:hypothetical protein